MSLVITINITIIVNIILNINIMNKVIINDWQQLIISNTIIIIAMV